MTSRILDHRLSLSRRIMVRPDLIAVPVVYLITDQPLGRLIGQAACGMVCLLRLAYRCWVDPSSNSWVGVINTLAQ